jgi:hypothetical protein
MAPRLARSVNPSRRRNASAASGRRELHRGLSRKEEGILGIRASPEVNQAAGLSGRTAANSNSRSRARRAEASAVIDASEGGRDGRVVDGGGLEKRIGPSDEFANFPVKSARGARYGSIIEFRPVVS